MLCGGMRRALVYYNAVVFAVEVLLVLSNLDANGHSLLLLFPALFSFPFTLTLCPQPSHDYLPPPRFHPPGPAPPVGWARPLGPPLVPGLAGFVLAFRLFFCRP